MLTLRGDPNRYYYYGSTLGVIGTKGYIILLRSLRQGPRHQMQFSVISKTPLGGWGGLIT